MNDTNLLNKQEITEALDISISSLNNYIQAGMPVSRRGKQGKPSLYNLSDCQQWIAEKIKQLDNEDMSAARLRKLQAEASLSELELQRERGLLVEIEVVAQEVAETLSTIKTRLLALPSKVSGIVLGVPTQREINDILDREMREVLIELSSSFAQLVEEEQEEDDAAE